MKGMGFELRPECQVRANHRESPRVQEVRRCRVGPAWCSWSPGAVIRLWEGLVPLSRRNDHVLASMRPKALIAKIRIIIEKVKIRPAGRQTELNEVSNRTWTKLTEQQQNKETQARPSCSRKMTNTLPRIPEHKANHEAPFQDGLGLLAAASPVSPALGLQECSWGCSTWRLPRNHDSISQHYS